MSREAHETGQVQGICGCDESPFSDADPQQMDPGLH